VKRTSRFLGSDGHVVCKLESGEEILLPVFPGILKHPTASELPGLLVHPNVARKYTREALRRGAWPIPKQFPHPWLLRCLDDACLLERRRRAIEFLLGVLPHVAP